MGLRGRGGGGVGPAASVSGYTEKAPRSGRLRRAPPRPPYFFYPCLTTRRFSLRPFFLFPLFARKRPEQNSERNEKEKERDHRAPETYGVHNDAGPAVLCRLNRYVYACSAKRRRAWCPARRGRFRRELLSEARNSGYGVSESSARPFWDLSVHAKSLDFRFAGRWRSSASLESRILKSAAL